MQTVKNILEWALLIVLNIYFIRLLVNLSFSFDVRRNFWRSIRKGRVNRKITISKAMVKLVNELKNDKDYRQGWKDNLSVSVQQSISSNKIQMTVEQSQEMADKAAENFLDLLCS